MKTFTAPFPLRFAGLLSFCFLPILLLLPQRIAAQTNINGVINTYKKVTFVDASKTRLGVPAATPGFAAGDRVLIIQMKGASVTTANTSSYGDITALNGAGYYEFNNVQGVATDSIFLAGPLCHNFNPNDSVQIIRVPVYTGTVNVTGTLTCDPFNGSTGGVLAFEVSGTLNLQADIDVSEKGYRGGNVFGNFFLCNNADFYSAQSTGTSTAEGRKGEGAAHYLVSQECGRGKLAQGGGGAGSGNTGAGGGANFGNGGLGGKEYSGCGAVNQSYGGEAIVPVPDRAFMGGGGGGPQRDNGNTVYNGGNGGGLVLVKATTITGNSNAIRSNGQGITNVIADEGTSGGGAGGSIYLLCNTFSTPLTIEAEGGVGGSNNNISFAALCHGPGGGGGGGLVWFSGGATPAGVTTTVTGGAAGTVNNPSSPCYNTTHGAEPGAPGGVLYNLVDGSYNPLNLRDTVVCNANAIITLDIGSGYTGVAWSTGATTNSIDVGPGTYSVEATTPLGCLIRDTAVIKIDRMTLGNDTVLCNGASLTLSPAPGGNYSSYQWSTGSTDTSITVTATGIYQVEVQTLSGCTLADEISITAVDVTFTLGNDNILCNGADLVLSVPVTGADYLWQDGTTTSSYVVSQTGTYSVVVSKNGCQSGDTVQVTAKDLRQDLGADILICKGTQVNIPFQLTAVTPGASILWSTGATGPSITAQQLGTYWVRIDDAPCSYSDTISIQEEICDCRIDIPSAFSPNGDGRNDRFLPIVEQGCVLRKFTLSIYNRWGQRVFSTTDPGKGWNGDWNGTPADMGTYMYLLETEAGTRGVVHQYKGDLVLVK